MYVPAGASTKRAFIGFAVLVMAAFLALPAASQALWTTLPDPKPAPTPAEVGEVATQGASIYYAVHFAEAGEGRPVILLHGGLGNSEHWGGQIGSLLKAEYSVITIDSRGQGRSTRAEGPLSYHLMASDVLAVMDHLEVEQAAIVGWSDGGNIGLDIAINHPERVARLFVFGSNFSPRGIKSPPKGSTTFPRYLKKARDHYGFISPNANDLPALMKALRIMWGTQPNFSTEDLAKIKAKVAVAVGEHDEIIRREHSEQMAKLIPNAELLILDNVSHFGMWQHPPSFNKAMIGFLKGK